MKTFRIISWFLMFVFCCVGAFFVSRWLATGVSAARARTVLQGKPYTMMQITLARGKDGSAKVTEQRTIAVNRDGAEVWLSTFPGHPDSGPIRRIIRSDGRATIAFEKFALRMTQYIPTRALNARSSYAEDAGKECRFSYEADLGRSSLAGVAVSVSQYEPTKSRRQTVWRALEYGCAPIGVRVEDLVDGRWELFAESSIAWFKAGDPPSELFDEGWFEQMQEASPAEVLRRIAAATGVDSVQCPACYNPATLQQLENEYYKRQSPQP